MAPAPPPVPLHDWTRVSAGKWHDMHLAWTGALRNELNAGVLPDPFFALAEPVTGRRARPPDVAVHASDVEILAGCVPASEAPVRFALFEMAGGPWVRRRVTVRHPDGDRVVAVVEFASPGNRDAGPKVTHFARTVADALLAGVHAVLIDPFPPTAAAPAGLHGAVMAELGGSPAPRDGRPLTFAGYCATGAGDEVAASVEPRAAGEPVPTVPLFLDSEWFLPLDLAPSYATAFRGCPKPVREVLTRAPAA